MTPKERFEACQHMNAELLSEAMLVHETVYCPECQSYFPATQLLMGYMRRILRGLEGEK